MEPTATTEPSDITHLETEVDRAVMSFVLDMKYKIRLNNKKGHWGKYDNSQLLNRIKDEVAELADAMQTEHDLPSTVARMLAVVHECADVANFCMMLADNMKTCIQGRRGRG